MQSMGKIVSGIFLVLFFVPSLSAQNGLGSNHRAYYKYRFNAGIELGYHRANFRVTPSHNWQRAGGDSLKTILSSWGTGFTIGIVTEMRLHEYVTLRFVPDFTLTQRSVVYHFEGRDTTDYVKRPESNFLNFPLLVKIRSKRLGNFAAYMTGGVQYTFDLAPQKDVNVANLTLAQQPLRLAKHDWGARLGAGVDFFFPYFKFGIDISYAPGFRNLLIRDNTIFSRTVESLHSNAVLISLTFEG